MDEVEEVGEAECKTFYEDEVEEDEIIESDVEFDAEMVEPDNDPPQKMGDSSVESSEEDRDAAQEAKGKAMRAFSEGNHEEAIEHLTHAILLCPISAMMYATRATVYIKMKKPNAAIRDANAALEINPDSAKGHKARGMALAMLGQWTEAAKDLHVASNIDYDEEISDVLKKVEPNAHKIEEHRRKYDRLHKEREDRMVERDRQCRKAQAQAAYEKSKKQEKTSSSRGSAGVRGGFPSGNPGGIPGGMPRGFGGMPGGGNMARAGGMPAGMPGAGSMPAGFDYSRIFSSMYNDPEMMAAMKNLEIIAALQEVSKDAENFEKYEHNPRVGPMLKKMFDLYRG
ncbi:FAM10 family protein At4g22670-like [Apium graveolens]|uniref:FAM10 family protein At4g22670-like n=1 Tax=Apium graveolens TaxID=4045 RepID=UPI003D78FD64